MFRIALILVAAVFYFLAIFFPLINAYLNTAFQLPIGYTETYEKGWTMFFCFVIGSVFVGIAEHYASSDSE